MSFLLLPLLFFLPGYLTARAVFSASDDTLASLGTSLSWGERVFVPIVFSVLLTMWFGLVLAEIGVFSLAALVALVVVYSALVFALRRKKLAAWSLRDVRMGAAGWIFLAVLILGAVLVANPAESILGLTDAGTYVNTGINIARTGALYIHDAMTQALPYETSRQFFYDTDIYNPYILYKQVRLPGFFVVSNAQGLVVPQFLHLYPVWIAIFEALFGLRLGLYATPVIGLLASVAAYFLTRTLFAQPEKPVFSKKTGFWGNKVALLAFFLLVISVPQFWFARYPISEALTQFLLVVGIYAFTRMVAPTLPSPVRNGSEQGRGTTPTPGPSPVQWGEQGRGMVRGGDQGEGTMPPFSRQRPWQTGEGVGGWGVASAWALLAALAFGETFLARVDAVLLLVPIGAYFLILRFSRVWRREHWIFFGVFAALLVHAAAHAWFFARGYVLYSYMHVLRTQDIGKRPLLLIAPALAALVVLFVLDFFAPRWMPRVTALGEKYWRVLVWGVLGVMVLGSAYAYLIAPHVTTLQAYFGGLMPPSRGANLVKLGWYVSPIGMGLALLGACVFLVRDLKKENVFFAGTALLFSVFYLDQLYSNPHYIYTFRHYIPLTLPAFLIFAARGVEFLWRGERWKPLGKLVAASALALWLIYNAYAMGLYDFTRATGLALRVPGLDAPTRIGGVQLEPFDQSIVGHTELGGAFDQVAAIAQQFDPRTVLIFAANRDDPGLLTVPLRFLYDRDPLNVRFNQPNGVTIGGVIEQLRAQGRDVLVLYGVNGGRLHLPDFKLTRVGEFTFETQQWAFAYDYMPRGAWTLNLHYTVFRPEPADAAGTPYPFRVEFAHGDEPYLAGGFLDVNDVAPNTRWVGKGALAKMPKNLTARLRLPLNTAAREQGVTVSLTARSPRPRDAASGVVQIKSGDTTVASAQLPDEWQTLVFQIPAEELNVQGDSFLLDLDINSFRDPVTGRVLGLELKEIVVR